ncbi:unnamed protein product [Musa textilis]
MSESQDSISDKEDEDADLLLDRGITCCRQDVTMVLLEQLCSVAVFYGLAATVHEPRQELRLRAPDEENEPALVLPLPVSCFFLISCPFASLVSGWGIGMGFRQDLCFLRWILFLGYDGVACIFCANVLLSWRAY